MQDVHEDLVAEYLEQQGYFVRQGFRYGPFNKELDLLAVKLEPREVLIACVTARYEKSKVESDMDKLKDPELVSAVTKLVGCEPTDRRVYCWFNRGEKNFRLTMTERGKEMGIRVFDLHEVLDELKKAHDKPINDPRFPLTTLLGLVPKSGPGS